VKVLASLVACCALLSGCAVLAVAVGAGTLARPAARATVTRTVFVGPRLTVGPRGGLATPGPPRRLRLTVFRDGCGVIRSGTASGAGYANLTWTFRDQDGFEVLGRNAVGETRYRYFRGGTYTVVLEAWVGDGYRAVSNRVTVHC
jgi:uncharacterized protein YceK